MLDSTWSELLASRRRLKYRLRNNYRYLHALVQITDRRKGRLAPRSDSPPDRALTHAALVLPGYLAPSIVTYPFEYMFDKYGRIPAFNHHMGLQSLRSFDTIVNGLCEHILGIFRAFPDLERLDIAAHSLSGLLSLNAIAQGVLDGRRCRLVTMGTPHNGTWTALPGCAISLSAYQMVPAHPRFWMREPNPRLASIPFLSLSGTRDWVVPPERCFHPQAENRTLLGFGHADLILSRSVFRIALEHFKTDLVHPVIRAP